MVATYSIALAAAAAMPFANGGCFELVRPVAEDRSIAREDVRAISCRPDTSRSSTRWQRKTRTIVARENLEANAYLGRLWFPDAPGVRAGDDVILRVSIGVVEIERAAVALQDAPAGKPFFARSAGGRVIVAPPLALQEKPQ